jgi:hypothetical protein
LQETLRDSLLKPIELVNRLTLQRSLRRRKLHGLVSELH